MLLAFYCDQIIPANRAIDARLLAGMGGRGRRVGYIPSGPEPTRRFYRERQAYYAQAGLDLTHFHELDAPQTPAALKTLFACDAIHLAGGHTAGFLARLRRAGLIEPLKAYARAGGALIGTSAGSILLTPTIAADALLSGNRPEDFLDAADSEALGLVPFEFFPHLDADPTYLPALLRYSVLSPRPIIACNDGDGFVVRDGVVEAVGAPVVFRGGEMRALESGRLVDV